MNEEEDNFQTSAFVGSKLLVSGGVQTLEVKFPTTYILKPNFLRVLDAVGIGRRQNGNFDPTTQHEISTSSTTPSVSYSLLWLVVSKSLSLV